MDSLEPRIDGFLAGTQWQNWTRHKIAADASNRSYLRLTSGTGQSVILALVPPRFEDFSCFLRIADRLDGAGLCVPTPLKSDLDIGLHVLTDLGTATLAECLAEKQIGPTQIKRPLIETLLKVRTVDANDLVCLDPDLATSMLDPLFENYGAGNRSRLSTEFANAFEQVITGHTVLSLRDFHAENIIWRNDGLGLLDFQDAFAAPEGYDLASYTRDVRRNVAQTERDELEQSFALALGWNLAQFQTQVAMLAIQRNLRIMGIFSKLISTGKTKYEAFLPRTWRYIATDLKRPEFEALEHTFHQSVPNPNERTRA